METTRRKFMHGGIAALCAIGATNVSRAGDETKAEANVGNDHRCLDYGLSFICNSAAFNTVRFWVESRTTIIDDKSGESLVFYQCGSCKSEHTFAEKNLLQEDNYDFLPILGAGDWLIFRRHCRLSERYRDVKRAEDIWGKPILKRRYRMWREHDADRS